MSDTNVQANNDALNFDLDALEDLPEFVTLPAGTYLLEGISLTTEVDDKRGQLVHVKCKVNQTVELKNDQVDKPVEDGTEATWTFQMQCTDKDGAYNEKRTKFSQGELKIITKTLSQFFGVTTFNDLAEKFPGCIFAAVTTVRTWTPEGSTEERKRSNIKTVMIE